MIRDGILSTTHESYTITQVVNSSEVDIVSAGVETVEDEEEDSFLFGEVRMPDWTDEDYYMVKNFQMIK